MKKGCFFQKMLKGKKAYARYKVSWLDVDVLTRDFVADAGK
jgi:hypothetical protein